MMIPMRPLLAHSGFSLDDNDPHPILSNSLRAAKGVIRVAFNRHACGRQVSESAAPAFQGASKMFPAFSDELRSENARQANPKIVALILSAAEIGMGPKQMVG
jgi:hypothetical protein